MSIFVYRLDTSSVAKYHFSGNLPKARIRIMKCVVSYIYICIYIYIFHNFGVQFLPFNYENKKNFLKGKKR